MERQTKTATKKKTVAKEVKEEKVLAKKEDKKATAVTSNKKKDTNATKKPKKDVKKIDKKEELEEVVVTEKVKKEVKKDNKKDNKEKKESFFKGVKSELSKVVWPSKRNMIKYSIATLVFIIFFALYFYGIEVIMAWLKANLVWM